MWAGLLWMMPGVQRGGQPVLAGLSALSAPLYGRAVPGPCVTLCMGWFVGTGSQIKSMCSGGHYLTGICTKFNLPWVSS